MQTIDAVLSRNNVQVFGKGRPVVMVHGFGCDQKMWDRLRPSLTDDLQVIQYDLTGMGDSDYLGYDTDKYGRLDGHADDLIEILEALDLEGVVAVGHSVSAIIVGLAAIKRPECFSALAMIGPSPCYLNKPDYKGGFSKEDIEGLLEAMEDNYQGWADQLATMVAGPEHEQTHDYLETRFCRNDPEISKHFARVTFLADNRGDLPRIKTPTLIIQNKKDAIANPDVGEYVQSLIPDSSLVMLDGAGHAPHMTDPGTVAGAIREFLRGH